MRHLLSLLLALPLAFPAAAEARRSRTRVAIVPMAASGRAARKLARRFTRKLVRRMRRNRRMRVVMLSYRKARRLRRCLQRRACTVKVARRLRVRYVLAGHITRLRRRRYHVDLRVTDGRDGRVLTSDAFRARGAWHARRAARLAVRLVYRARRKVRRGIRVAKAPASRTTDASMTFTPDVIAMRNPRTGKVIEARDGENPLTPGEEKKAQAHADEASSSAGSAERTSAPQGEAVAQADSAQGGSPALDLSAPQPDATEAETQPELSSGPRDDRGLLSRLFSKRYAHAWITAGAGIAALGVGAAFGVLARQGNAAAHAAATQLEAWKQRDGAQKNAIAANVLLGAGGAAVLTSVLLFYLEHRQEMSELRRSNLNVGVQVAKKGAGVSISGSF